MTSCELCAKPATTRARVEGVAMAVCAACARFGVELVPPKPARPGASVVSRQVPSARPRPPMPVDDGSVLAPDAAKRIRDARSRKGLTFEEATKALLIRESTLRHYETGSHQPTDADVKKLERYYGITLRVPDE